VFETFVAHRQAKMTGENWRLGWTFRLLAELQEDSWAGRAFCFIWRGSITNAGLTARSDAGEEPLCAPAPAGPRSSLCGSGEQRGDPKQVSSSPQRNWWSLPRRAGLPSPLAASWQLAASRWRHSAPLQRCIPLLVAKSNHRDQDSLRVSRATSAMKVILLVLFSFLTSAETTRKYMFADGMFESKLHSRKNYYRACILLDI